MLKSPPASPKVRVCRVDEIPLGLGRAFQVGGVDIAVFRSRSGTIHAVENRCPHRGGPLAEGMLAGHRVVCPFHAFRFDLQTGDCDEQSVCGVTVFSAEVSEASVWVSVPVATAVGGPGLLDAGATKNPHTGIPCTG